MRRSYAALVPSRLTASIAVAAALVVLCAACGGDSKPPPPAASPAASEPAPAPPAEPVPEPPPEPPVDPGPVIAVLGGEPVDGVTRIKVKNGDTARFSVASDVPAEVHVHGLDVTKDVGPEKNVRFKLETSFEGIFEIELHGPAGDVQIASLVIEPR